MDHSKIKNLIIVILLLLNVFLLATQISDRAESRRSAQEALDTAKAIIAGKGIAVGDALESYVETPSVYRLRRDLVQEEEKIRELLGKCSASDMGGNIWFYNAAGGQASLRGTGELDVLFSGNGYDGSSPEKTAEKVLARLGMELGETSTVARESGGADVLEVTAAWNGGPVYNAKMKLSFDDDALLMATGTRLLDHAENLGTAGVMDMLTVTMRFMEVLEQEGRVCSELLSMDVGYLMSVTVSGESTLTPVWHFLTDTGDIYINALTGKTETVL